MPSDHHRKWSSGSGTAQAASTAAPVARGLPATGTAPGAHRGSGLGAPFGATERTDAWWVKPLVQALGLILLLGYANWAAFLGAEHYHYVENGRHYLSPFYSPYLNPAWLPSWISPALLILIFPLGFRATCYYYRKAYYRVFFADPVECAVGEARKGYCGELRFPFILQNLHRFFLYAAIVFLFILWWDVFLAFRIGGQIAIGGGSLAILASTGTLTLYTLSCHSLRHIIGGRLDCFSCVAAGGPRLKTWNAVTRLNEHHMAWAWWSLGAVCFADLYVRLCSMDVVRDPLLMTFGNLFKVPGVGGGP
jgi:hypothetical protein